MNYDIRENYKKLLIDYPEGNPDPFEYTGSEYPYILYLTNRNHNCSMLMKEKLLQSEVFNGTTPYPMPREFGMGYTCLDLLKREFVLHLNGHAEHEILFNDNHGEDDLIADGILIVYHKRREEHLCITNAAWAYRPNLIRALTGKEKYSISDVRKIIKSITNGNDTVYACIGFTLVWDMDWH